MAGSITCPLVFFNVGYWIFWLEWGSEDSKMVTEFYEKKKFMDNVSLLDWREEIASDSQNGK